MTTKARIVLQDVRMAIAAHSDTLQAESFRISWIAIVTLLRAVGHVLKNVDAFSSPSMKLAVDRKWKELNASKPEPQIFWGFIELERNRFLKDYEHGVRRRLVIPLPIVDGKQRHVSVDVGNGRGGEIGPGKSLDSVLSSGPFAGQSEKTVAWQAYNWWVEYLNVIDRLSETDDTLPGQNKEPL